ncbi:MAG TPA: serine/threonine-protein kinase [Planctomycetaceae bacterium]|nr:serine/threonine-protein kinase [Planctomycetaceae bacterium]
MIDRDPIELLAAEFVDRYRRGERPPIAEYVGRCADHAELAERVRTTFPALALMEDLAVSDFESFDESKHTVAVAEEMPLEQLGDYRIIREIGRGGMGVVYEAEQLSLGRHVALKVLSRAALQNPRQIKRFEHEARAAARLHHTNIVPVFDVGAHEGILFYVMQFIQGASLDQVLDDVKRLRDIEPTAAHSNEAWEVSLSEVAAGRHRATRRTADGNRRSATRWDGESRTRVGEDDSADQTTGWRSGSPVAADEDTALNRLSDTATFSGRAMLPGTTEAGQRTATYFESVARIGVQVADALAYAHAQGVTHRDIKPSNLLLDTRGIVWITDFGLAKTRDQENLTHTGDFVGTLRYMAPERFAENSDPNTEVDPRSDIYSLGLTLYEMLAFRPAFDADRQRLMRQVMDGKPVRLRKLSPDVPRDLETIVHKAIERNPAHRLQTAAEFAADLRRFLDDEPIRARRVSLPERVWRWCRRNPAQSWTTLGALAVVVATLAFAFTWMAGERNRYAQLAQEKAVLAEQNEELARLEGVARMAAVGMAEDERNRANREQLLRAEAEQAARERKAINDFLMLGVLSAAQPDAVIERRLAPQTNPTMRQVLDTAAHTVETAFPDNPRTQAAVRLTIGRAYNALGAYTDAERQLVAALEPQRKLLGDEHFDTLDTWNALAISLLSQGRYAESRQQQQQVFNILAERYGPQHLDTLVAMGNLAITYLRLDELTEARRLLEGALVNLRQTVGARHPQTIRTLVNLGVTLHMLGLYEKAHVLLQEAAESRDPRTLANTHPLTLSILTNLALNLNKLGRPHEAEQQARRVYAVQRQVLGDEHPSTLTTRGNIAQFLDYQGKFADAHPLHEKVLAARVHILGEDHPDTLATRTNLAANLVLQQQHDDAVRIYTEVVAALQKRLGLEHSLTLQAMNNLAAASAAQGMFAVAHQEFTRVVELAAKSLGPEHRITLKFRRNLAENLERQARIEDAEREYRDVLRILTDRYGAGHRSTLQTAGELAAMLLRQQQPVAAVALLKDSIAAAEQSDARNDWPLAALESRLGEALAAGQQYPDAERTLLAAHQRLATLPFVPPYELRQTLGRLVALYESWQRPDHTEVAARWQTELDHLGPASGHPPPTED